MKFSPLARVLVVTLLASATGAVLAGGQPPAKSTPEVIVSPLPVALPMSSASGFHVCVSGFSPGNFVSVVVPWVGSAIYHSSITINRTIDETGGFCAMVPPDWTTLQLEPGVYTIRASWFRDSASPYRQNGPTATFGVN